MIVGVLLAAGSGSRFGGDKLVAPLPGGTPVGVRAARTLRGAVDRGVAVVRPDDLLLARQLEQEGFDVAPFAGAEAGMGASLAFGVRSSSDASGWLVALADMPFVLPATVKTVSGRIREGAWIAAPSYRGRRGHPVGFSRLLYPDLIGLHGDAGARPVLAVHSGRVETIECDDPGVLSDVDTVSDLVSV